MIADDDMPPLESLTGDDLLIAHTPLGRRWNMIAASLAKRVLQEDMPAGLRLRFLECLNAMIGLNFTAEMLAMIEPMCDTAFEIWKEAKTLDPKNDKACMASFNVLASWRVFHHFLELNPSILAAIKWLEKNRHASAADMKVYGATAATEHRPRGDGHVPTTYAGPTSDYGIPDRFLSTKTRDNFAIGSPGHAGGPIDPHTGH